MIYLFDYFLEQGEKLKRQASNAGEQIKRRGSDAAETVKAAAQNAEEQGEGLLDKVYSALNDVKDSILGKNFWKENIL